MWKVPKPDVTAIECFDTCIAGIRDPKLKTRMRSIRQNIIDAEKVFESAASNANLHLLSPEDNIGKIVTAEEMKNLYDRHMAREKSKGRDIYDKIMLAAPDDRCPLCGHRDVSTLDHCLPKAQHPSVAVTAINLIPCCKDCNHIKGNPRLARKIDQFLNAYYDDVPDDVWLCAKIVEGSPAGIRFFAKPPNYWDLEMSARVLRHFERLELAKLYASQGGRQLRNIRGALKEFYNAGGMDAVREDLWRSHRSCSEVELNSWLAALYRTAAESDWYCNGGFES